MGAKWSRLGGGLHIGASFFERRGALAPKNAGNAAPKGVVDALADLRNPEVDVTRVHPDVARFFDDTASLELHIVSHWRFPFSIVWWFLRPVMALIGQFVLPRHEARILTRVHAVDTARDGRADARIVIREYAQTGQVMQAVAYATWAKGDTRFMNAAFPLPLGHLTGLLRLRVVGEDDQGRLAVGVTSRGGSGAGVWYVIGGVAIPLPLEEQLDLWAPSMPTAPRPLDLDVLPGTTIVGRHEQRCCGIRMVTHRYWFRPRTDGAS